MNTSDKLKALFDFQGFSKSEKLEGVINSTLASVENQINDADLDMVSAAGYSGDISAEAGIVTIVDDKWDDNKKPGIFRPGLFDPFFRTKTKGFVSENIWDKDQEGEIIFDQNKDSALKPKKK